MAVALAWRRLGILSDGQECMQVEPDCVAFVVYDANGTGAASVPSTCSCSIPVPLGFVTWGYCATAVNTLAAEPTPGCLRVRRMALRMCSKFMHLQRVFPRFRPGVAYCSIQIDLKE